MDASEINATLELDEKLGRGQNVDLSGSYFQRVSQGNYVYAEGLTYESQSNIEKIRTLISRGVFNEALESLEKEIKAKVHPEQIFELVRVKCYQGDFSTALPLILDLVKQSDLNPLSRMTAYQILGLCQFELGNDSEAISAIERVLSLECIYPKAEASLFARSILVRVLAKTNATGLARKELKELWERIANGKYSLNTYFQIIMYLRALSDLNILEKKCALPPNLAGMWIARAMGSPLHEALFIQTLSRSNNLNFACSAKADLEIFLKRFEGLPHFISQKIYQTADENVAGELYSSKMSKLLFIHERAVFDLQSGELRIVELTPQNIKIILAIGNQGTSKETLYQKIWGAENYHPEFHDMAIRTAIKRLRKQIDLAIDCENSSLRFPQTIVIL